MNKPEWCNSNTGDFESSILRANRSSGTPAWPSSQGSRLQSGYFGSASLSVGSKCFAFEAKI